MYYTSVYFGAVPRELVALEGPLEAHANLAMEILAILNMIILIITTIIIIMTLKFI